MKKKVRKKKSHHGIWYLYMMLVVFWPLSIYEYVKISRYLKKKELKWNWGVQSWYWILAPCCILTMTGCWVALYVFFRYYAFK